MLIYHCVQVENFELRHAWQVSTILQQEGFKAKIMLDVAVVEGSTNRYRLEEFMLGDVALRYFETPREVFARRGWTRNQQIDRARGVDADWMFFSDADHIYHPSFFRHLVDFLKQNPRERGVITGAAKLHTRRKSADRLMKKTLGVFPHKKAFDQVAALPMMDKQSRVVAGGAMQVVSLDAIDNHRKRWNGLYVPYEKAYDRHLFDECQLARSDIAFRQSFRSGVKVIWDLPLQIHMQHRRDKEHGNKTHIEEQR